MEVYLKKLLVSIKDRQKKRVLNCSNAMFHDVTDYGQIKCIRKIAKDLKLNLK